MNRDLRRPPDATAVEAAVRAAAAARVGIKTLETVAELDEVRRLFELVWRTGEAGPPVTADMMVALAKAGSYVSGAFDGGELVAACLGFFSAPARAGLHSHITGVLDRMRGRHVGFALKLHQRAWAMARGINEITWTYDPLISRNAYFNLAKLGAEAVEYLPDFYGPMDDAINSGDPSDRVLVRWRLSAPTVVDASRGVHHGVDATAALRSGARIALDRSTTGRPIWGTDGAGVLLVATPSDIERMRSHDPTCASDWRSAQRDVLGALMAEGAHVRGFDRAGWYVIDRTGRGDVS